MSCDCCRKRDLDDDPLPMPRPPPAEPSWEMLAAPTSQPRVTVAALRAAAERFDGPRPVAGAEAFFAPMGLASVAEMAGWIERAEMRGEDLWGLVRWVLPERYPHGVGAVLDFGADPIAGTPVLSGGILREPEPTRPR